MRNVLGLILLCSTAAPAAAFSYTGPTLAEAVAAHEVVLVARVEPAGSGVVTATVVSVLRGEPPGPEVTLPDTWRPGTEHLWGPVPLRPGRTYLLMLQRGDRGAYVLSRDFSAPAVKAVDGPDDPTVRAAAVLSALMRAGSGAARKQVLKFAADEERRETKVKLIGQFAAAKRDPETAEFVVRALDPSPEPRDPLIEGAVYVARKHGYRQAIPALLKLLRERPAPVAEALGVLKAREAYEPMMELMESGPSGFRPSLMRALGYLGDRRAVPFLLGTLHDNLRNRGPKDSSLENETAAAAEALGRMRVAEAVGPLTRLLKEGYGSGPGFAAAEALGEIGPPARAVLPRLRLMRSDAEYRAKVWSANSFGGYMRRFEAAAAHAIRQIEDGDATQSASTGDDGR